MSQVLLLDVVIREVVDLYYKKKIHSPGTIIAKVSAL